MTIEISLAEWSLHRAIRSGEVLHRDLPRLARRDFDIGAIELVSQLMDSSKPEALKDFRRRCDDEGVRTHLVMVDDQGDLSSDRGRLRKKAIARHRGWVDVAATLGAGYVRVNTGGRTPRAWNTPANAPELAGDIGRFGESLLRLAEHAAALGVCILLENHGGLSASIPAMLEVIRRVGKENVGTLPDFGNFSDLSIAYAAVGMMMPEAQAVSAKSFEFDADGNETRLDYAKLLKIVVDSGFEGCIGIEFEGAGVSEFEGVRLTKALIERVLSH